MTKWFWIAAGVGLAVAGAVSGLASYSSIEKPAFTVLKSEGDFELREYAPIIVAETSHAGDRSKALNAGFRRLAAYIFAEDRPGKAIPMTSPVLLDQVKKIAMTSPVLQDGQVDGEWRTRFVMPSEYTMATLPAAPDDIVLEEVPARQLATIAFSGNPGSEELKRQEYRLRDWMKANDMGIGGPAEYAFYDAPMVPAPLRRNEVMIPVEIK
ncbi:heme-binding protein [Altererythrobacter sp.]|nr:heme-binding protein [Altererythrobacter sp.]